MFRPTLLPVWVPVRRATRGELLSRPPHQIVRGRQKKRKGLGIATVQSNRLRRLRVINLYPLIFFALAVRGTTPWDSFFVLFFFFFCRFFKLRHLAIVPVQACILSRLTSHLGPPQAPIIPSGHTGGMIQYARRVARAPVHVSRVAALCSFSPHDHPRAYRRSPEQAGASRAVWRRAHPSTRPSPTHARVLRVTRSPFTCKAKRVVLITHSLIKGERRRWSTRGLGLLKHSFRREGVTDGGTRGD